MPQTQTLIEPNALYGRMIRLRDKSVLCSFEKDGKSWVRASRDNGKTWQPPVLAAQFAFGIAANPELLQTRRGTLLLFFNARPRPGSNQRFAIGLTASRDNGKTWDPPRRFLFEADTNPQNGCWEPAPLELPSGEIQVFFANEFPYQRSDEQEISLCRSLDDGQTWSRPQTICFRAGHRDGMPVPILLIPGRKNGPMIAVAIEDNGLPTSTLLQPAVFTCPLSGNWRTPPVGGDSPRRWGAVTPPLAADVYAGAPYLRQFPSGETVLSCHTTEGRRAVNNRKNPRMVVYVGDREAKNFANPTYPFPIPDDVDGMWNALFIKDATTVTALSSTTINGTRGLWAIDGRLTQK